MKKRFLLPLACLDVLCAAAPSGAQSRYALVVGNAAYRQVPRLANTANDARDIAAALGTLGYQVDLKLDLTNQQLTAAVDSYTAKLRSNRGNEGFFWFAGHGIQENGENYLLPVDITKAALTTGSLSLNALLDKLHGADNKVNVVILDACRNNPFKTGRGVGTRGLAVVNDIPNDLFVMFSTAPGTEADDGVGVKNSPFAAAFLKHIASPEALALVAVDVSKETLALTDNEQRPFIRGSIISDKYYSLNPAAVPPAAPVPVVLAPAAPANPFYGPRWEGTLFYTDKGIDYADTYTLTFGPDGRCIVTVTDDGGLFQDADGRWSYDDTFLRVNCTFPDAPIPRLKSLRWVSVYTFGASRNSFRVLVPPYPNGKNQTLEFVRTED